MSRYWTSQGIAPLRALCALTLSAASQIHGQRSLTPRLIRQLGSIQLPMSVVIGQGDFAYSLDQRASTLFRYGSSGAVHATKLDTESLDLTSARISAAGAIGDTLWFWDAARTRLLKLPLGSVKVVEEVIHLPHPVFEGAFFGVKSIRHDGSLVVEEFGTAVALGSLSVVGRRLLHISRSGRVLDTIATLRERDAFVQLQARDGRLVTARQPWAARDMFACSPDGLAEALVRQENAASAAEQGVFSLALTLPFQAGTMQRIVPYVPLQFADSTWQRFAERLAHSRFGEAFSTVGAATKAIGEQLFRPETVSPVSAVLVASSGEVWIQRADIAGGEKWQIFEPRDSLVREVSLPLTVHPVAVSNRRLWVVKRLDARQALLSLYMLGESAP